MARLVDLKKRPMPINLVDFIRLYDTMQRGNYALEFLTAATYGGVDIPLAGSYQLPPDVEERDLRETLEQRVEARKIENRAQRIERFWEQGSKPWAIRAMDELRSTKNPEFRLDLLNPRLYDGTHSEGNHIPFAVNILPGLAYLYISVLISGFSAEVNRSIEHPNPKGECVIYPSSRLPKGDLKVKIRGTYSKNRKDGVKLKQGHSNILHLLGMPMGDVTPVRYEELGLGFIERLAYWVEKSRLDEGGYEHAMRTLQRVVEAFADHRYGAYNRIDRRGSEDRIRMEQVFYLPAFPNQETDERFSNFFNNVWTLVNPDIPLMVSRNETDCGYTTRFYPSAKHARKLKCICQRKVIS